MKARYLTFFSYIGTNFRSSEKIWLKEGKNYPDPQSVQGLIELGLKKLRSLNYPNVTLSSRTDGGVHALNASAHFDLERYGSKIYEPHSIAYALNKFFLKSDTNILIRDCHRVNDNFSARYKAIKRTYLYRLAVLKESIVVSPEIRGIGRFMPIEEFKRCHIIRVENFDINLLKEGAKYFIGYHDFTTFKRFDKLKQYKHNRREIYDIVVKPGKPLVHDLSRFSGDIFEYWDIVFVGRAYVHNQIRRMMGTLISVATGKLAPEEIKLMLQVPSKHSWRPSIQNCPPDGLYLVNVDYNPDDLIYTPSETEHQIVEDSQCDSDSE